MKTKFHFYENTFTLLHFYSTNIIIFTFLLITTNSLVGQVLQWEDTGAPKEAPAIDLVASENLLVAGYYGLGIYIKRGRVGPWTLITEGDERFYSVSSIAISPDDIIYVTTRQGKVFETRDVGGRWEDISPNFIQNFVFCSLWTEHALYVGTDAGLGVFDLGSEEWSFSTLAGPNGRSEPVFSLAKNNDESILAGSRGFVGTFGADGELTPSEKFTKHDITALLTFNQNWIAATSGSFLFARPIISQDRNWFSFPEQIASSLTKDLAIYNGLLIKGSPGRGVHVGPNRINEGIRVPDVLSLFVFSGDIYAGTQDEGIYRMSMVGAPVGDVNLNRKYSGINGSPDFSIIPNPADQQIRISWSGNETKGVARQYSILDGLGRKVRSGRLPDFSQTGSENINISALSAGTYRIRILFEKGSMIQSFTIQ